MYKNIQDRSSQLPCNKHVFVQSRTMRIEKQIIILMNDRCCHSYSSGLIFEANATSQLSYYIIKFHCKNHGVKVAALSVR